MRAVKAVRDWEREVPGGAYKQHINAADLLYFRDSPPNDSLQRTFLLPPCVKPLRPLSACSRALSGIPSLFDLDSPPSHQYAS